MELYISTTGNDHWSGLRAAANKAKTDGPLATLAAAQKRIRELKRSGQLAGPVTVYLRGGRYPLRDPLVFTPDDSAPVTYTAYKTEQPILDGGETIKGFSQITHNGQRAWVAQLADVAQGRWCFKDLFVNGKRRYRPRLPKKGFYRIQSVPGMSPNAGLFDGDDTFIAAGDDFKPFANLTDIDVMLHHYWVEERMPVASFDPDTHQVRSTRRSIFALKKGFSTALAEYFLENVYEGLSEAGEWYLDRTTGRLIYLPLPGEELAKAVIVAPRLTTLLHVKGDAETGGFVEFLRLERITFAHAGWEQPPGGVPDHDRVPIGVNYGADAQAAFTVPGALRFTGARYCAIEDCTVTHVGGYGIELGEGCAANRVIGNHIFDIGAGGVKLAGSNSLGSLALRTGNNRITDNQIHDIGEVFKSGIGVLSAHSFGNLISHNHIHDTHYSGISVGWVWGYGDSVSKDNTIEFNHIHHIGKGVLSDLGGIYALGVQPGTTIRNNLIHDVRKDEYGGWAIYLDEGSSHIVIENNVCFNTDSTCFNVHYGRESVVRNNIFAFGGEGLVSLGRAESHNAFTFQCNIVLTRGQPIHICGYGSDLRKPRFQSDHNVLFDFDAKTPLGGADPRFNVGGKPTLRQLREVGIEVHSLVADPGFRDPVRYDFRLKPNAAALAVGFHPIDLSTVGPRPRQRRKR